MADLWLQFLLTIDATLRVATPLILCAMAGIFSEKSGVIDISLEGKMLMSAFVAAAVATLTSSALAGMFEDLPQAERPIALGNAGRLSLNWRPRSPRAL